MRCSPAVVRRRLIDKMWTVTISDRFVPLGRAMAITGLGLMLGPLGRLHAQATTPPLPPATANQPTQSSTPAQTPAQGQTGSQNQPGLLPRDEPASTTETFKVFSREVDLIFTVTDRRGHFVTGLAQQDFGLLDDGRPPANVLSFKQQTNLPLRVGILIDTSTSIRQRFQFEQQAATAFLLQIMHPQTDKAFIEGFDVTPDYRQDWTNNLDALTSGIDALRSGGGTALYDAVYSGCRDKLLT